MNIIQPEQQIAGRPEGSGTGYGYSAGHGRSAGFLSPWPLVRGTGPRPVQGHNAQNSNGSGCGQGYSARHPGDGYGGGNTAIP